MFKKPLFLEVLILAILIAVLHYIALQYSLYWVTDWFDIIMHFLGGFWVAIFIIFIVYILRWVQAPCDNRTITTIITIGAVLMIGLAWELWELLSGLTFVFKDKADTILDLIMDTIGGVGGLSYGIRYVCRRER